MAGSEPGSLFPLLFFGLKKDQESSIVVRKAFRQGGYNCSLGCCSLSGSGLPVWPGDGACCEWATVGRLCVMGTALGIMPSTGGGRPPEARLATPGGYLPSGNNKTTQLLTTHSDVFRRMVQQIVPIRSVKFWMNHCRVHAGPVRGLCEELFVHAVL